MTAITVLVTFYSRAGTTESLAHAAAVGAVQKRGLIRLRRVADLDQQATLARNPAAGDSLRRMYKEYVTPKEADVLAAQALIVGSAPDLDAASPEWAPFFDLLAALASQGKLAGKVAGVIGTGASAASFAAALAQCGLTLVPTPGGGDVDQAIVLGREVVAAVEGARTKPERV